MHIERLSSTQALGRFPEVLGTADSARRLLATIPGHTVYLASYRFGRWITNPRSSRDSYSRLIPPCHGAAPCSLCADLNAATSRHRALGIVLRGAVEEYATVHNSLRNSKATLRPATGTPDQAQISLNTRNVPLNLSSAGQFVNLTEAANVLVFRDYGASQRLSFESPVRRAVAGARSIYLTAPMKRAPAIELLKELIPNPIRQRYFELDWGRYGRGQISRIVEALDSRHHDVMMMLNDTVSSNWRTEVLWIPLDSIRTTFEALHDKGAEFAAVLLSLAWERMRPSHNAQMRMAAMTAAVYPWTQAGSAINRRSAAENAYVEQTTHHILNMARGDTICYAPWNVSDDCGPFGEIQNFIGQTEIASRGIWPFPAVMVPTLLNSGVYCAGYYSFAEPSIMAPIAQKEVIGVMRSVLTRLRKVRTHSPGLLDGADFKMYQGQGGGVVSGIPSFRDRYSVAKEIAADFDSQFGNATKGWGLSNISQMLPGAKRGFLSRFVRLSMSTKR